jgi:hypothetical protein
MSHKTAATVAHTIGIDTGKNTLHSGMPSSAFLELACRSSIRRMAAASIFSGEVV